METVFFQQARGVLKEYFGYDAFRPLQYEIISALCSGSDVMALMPTGGGKSICFQIPPLLQNKLCIVVSPLIALMRDQVQALRQNGIYAAEINSSQSLAEQQLVLKDCYADKIKLLYVAPEKLAQPQFLATLKNFNIGLFAIDEAHCISFWGHDFRPEYAQLSSLKQNFPDAPIIALTATADSATRKDIVQQLRLNDPKVFISSFDRPNIQLNVLPAFNRSDTLHKFLAARDSESGIIYCLGRKTTESVAERLRKHGFSAAAYHAGLETAERSRVQDAFLKDDIQIVCATIAFGMGINKSNIRWIIHYNLPKNIESYYQEIGRSGRDGLDSEAMLFYSKGDVITCLRMIEDSEPMRREVQLAKLDRLVQFVEANECRRKILLAYFGENLEHDCGRCDVCSRPRQKFDATRYAQMALSAVYRLKQQVSVTTLIDVLRGSRKKTIIDNKYDNIPTFGVGKELSEPRWQDLIWQMINVGLMDVVYDDSRRLTLTALSRSVLFDGEKVLLASGERVTPQPAVKMKKIDEPDDKNLFERLRKLRKTIAARLNIAPDGILSDDVLTALAQRKPTHRASFEEISGVSRQKVETYWKLFTDEIIDYLIEQYPPHKLKGHTRLQTLALYQKGYTPETIARERNLNESTIWGHLSELLIEGYAISVEKLLTNSEKSVIYEAIDVVLPNEKPITAVATYLFENYGVAQLENKIRLALALKQKEGAPKTTAANRKAVK